MVTMDKNFKHLKNQIQYVVDILQGEQQNPPELQDKTRRLLMDAKKLDGNVSLYDFDGFRKVLGEMKQDAWKARTIAALRPDLSTRTQRNLDFVHHSIDTLWNASGFN